MLKITDDNYQHYKKIFIVLDSFLWQQSPLSGSATNVLEQWEERNGLSTAKKALKIGLLDFFSWIKLDKSLAEKQILNQILINQQLPSLWELLAIVNDVPDKVLKRGKIRNLDEWYVIKEVLDDLDSGISHEQRNKLGEYFLEFEMKAAKKNK